MSQLPPPGWYDDPTSPVLERWWDGEQWSEQTRRKMKQPPRTEPGQLSKIGDLLSDTFNMIGARWDDLLMVAVVAGALQALAAVLLIRPIVSAIDIVNDQFVGWTGVHAFQVVAFVFVTLGVTLVASLAYHRICWEAANDRETSWSAGLVFGWTNAARLVGWAIIGLLPVVGGIALFFASLAVNEGLATLVGIAGFIAVIWWGVIMSFVPISIAALPRGSNPILSSLALARGRWWKLFGRLILVGLMTGLISGAVGAIVGRFTGNDIFGFVLTDLGNGELEITKDLDGHVGFFLSNAAVFIYSIAFTVLQVAAGALIAFDVWRRPERDTEPELDLGF